MSELTARLEQIKKNLEARDTGRGDSAEVAVAKARLNEAKSKSRMLQQEKRNIYDQISAADDLKKQQQDLTTRLKAQLTFFSVEEIERRIKALEHKQQTSSLTIKEDKAMMEEIKRLSSNKPMIRQYDEAQESLKGVRDHHTTLYTQLKAKNADLTVVKEEEEKLREALDKVKSKDDAKKADVPALFKERDQLRKDITEHRDTIRKLRDDFNEQRKEWQTYLRQQKEIKQKEFLERKALRQAEYEAQKKAWEEEEAKRDPWEQEKLICEQLLVFCAKYLPKADAGPAEEKVVDHGKFVPVTKANLDDDDPYAGLKKTKSKRKGGGGGSVPGAPASLTKQKSMKLVHAPEDLGLWSTLGFKAPATSDECVGLHEQLLAKREWLKTAPPKQKKKAEPSSSEKAKKAADAAAADAADDAAAEDEAAEAAPAPTGGAAPGEFIQVVAVSDSKVQIRFKF